MFPQVGFPMPSSESVHASPALPSEGTSGLEQPAAGTGPTCPDQAGTASPRRPARDRLDALDLPEEVSTQDAARILGTSKHTVLHLKDDGLLEWRNAAPPSSSRPVFRFTLRSVLALRTRYHQGERPCSRPADRPRRPRATTPYTPRHIRRVEVN